MEIYFSSVLRAVQKRFWTFIQIYLKWSKIEALFGFHLWPNLLQRNNGFIAELQTHHLFILSAVSMVKKRFLSPLLWVNGWVLLNKYFVEGRIHGGFANIDFSTSMIFNNNFMYEETFISTFSSKYLWRKFWNNSQARLWIQQTLK